MKILIDLQACQACNRERGIGRYSLALAQEMVKQAGGHDIQIMLSNNFPETIAPLQQAFADLLPEEKIKVIQLPTGVSESDPKNTWRSRAAEHVRQRYIDSLAPDIVHVHSLFEGWSDDAVTSVSPLVPPGKIAVTLYDLIPLLNKNIYLPSHGLSNWYYRKLQSLKNADLLLAISDHSRQEAITALHLPESQICNISSAVAPCYRPLDLSPEAFLSVRKRYGLTRPFLMYTGGIDHRKNIEGLIEAFALLDPAVRTRYQLAIICRISEADRQKLQALAQRQGLNHDDLICTGFVDDDDLIALYNSTTLFVFPSFHEGFGLPALEAMACGAAVVGSDRSSIPEVIGRQDALFDPTSPQQIANKINQALTDSHYLSSLREHGLVQAGKFSWEKSAQAALAGFEDCYDRRDNRPAMVGANAPRRPRLAYISPLPHEKTGIADYSAELLPELARYYEIEVVTEQDQIGDDWLEANFPLRRTAWFSEHADRYERIIYHFGNSAFHQHMFQLLEQHPGTVVLHDFFLGGVLNYLDHTRYLPGCFQQALYHSHGYQSLIECHNEGDISTVWKYPCSKSVTEQATGVIVHSQFSRQLAEHWYGAGISDDWQVIPLIRAVPNKLDRQAARLALDIKDTDFLFCAFGMLGPSKLNLELVDAWLDSTLAGNAACRLCFVGGNDDSGYAQELKQRIESRSGFKRIKITGFATLETYRNYLSAADIAVQLRTHSRGETSASILDCLAYGIPTIINVNGAAAEIPDELLVKLPDAFVSADLVLALETLHSDVKLRHTLSQKSVRYIQEQNHPAKIGKLYYEAIEQNYTQSKVMAYQKFISAIADITITPPPIESDLLAVAASTAANHLPSASRQMFVDISEYVRQDAKTGIQRVVRNILDNLLKSPPEHYRIEPIYNDGSGYRYARKFVLGLLGIVDIALNDTYIEPRAGDLFLGLDLSPHVVPQHEAYFVSLRNSGVKIHFIVYDLLPVLRPDAFIEGAEGDFDRWLKTVTRIADRLICISQAVAEDLERWIEKNQRANARLIREKSPAVLTFSLGADIAMPLGETATETELGSLPEEIFERPVFLMVGTLEPRKAHAQVLDAFEQLWNDDIAVNLVIVGKKGWKVDELLSRLNQHPKINRNLFWLEGATDSTLVQLYNISAALILASEAEGFGLPLIEAAQYKLPLIVRDIAVFREVAGEHACYFDGQAVDSLVNTLRQWISLSATGQIPLSEKMSWLNWQQSTQQLIDQVTRK